VKYNNSNFFRWIKKCNQYDLRQFVPFVVGNQVVGNQVVGNQRLKENADGKSCRK